MRARVSLLFFLMVALAGCAEQAPLAGAPCPCVAGWTCCPNIDVCVAEGDVCPVDDLEHDFMELSTLAYMADLGVDRGACAGTMRDGTGTVERSWSIRKTSSGVEVTYADETSDREIYEFTQGRPVRARAYSFGTDDPVKTYEEKWSYVQDGRLDNVTVTTKVNLLGFDAQLQDYHYFQDGHVTVDLKWCCTDEGGFDARRTIQYDADGRILREELDDKDDNGNLDGIPESVSTRTYGPYGLVEKLRSGSSGSSALTTYSYDDQGRNTGYSFTIEGDSVLTIVALTMTKTWDDDGRLARREYTSTRKDGTVEVDTTDYQYDCR